MKFNRINDQVPVKSQRLVIAPMSERELAGAVESERDQTLKTKLSEMRRDVADHPDQALWYTGWRISLKQSGQAVGVIAFQGMQQDRTVSLGFDIDPQYRGNGYAAEAIDQMVKWAFQRENVYFIHVLIDADNAACNHLLQQQKFYRVQSPMTGQNLWELERPASIWTLIFLLVGFTFGLMFGSAFFGSQALGLIIVTCAGITLGAVLDSKDRAARKRAHEPEKIDPLNE